MPKMFDGGDGGWDDPTRTRSTGSGTFGVSDLVRLVFLHSGRIKMATLTPGKMLTVGRDPNATVYFADATLSRTHARFELSDGRVWIEDLGSSNGTFVNGELATRREVNTSDRISLGAIGASFHFETNQPPNATLVSQRQLSEELDRAIERAETSGRQTALLMARLPQHDAVPLATWAQGIQLLLPEASIVARYSDHIAQILLPQVDRKQVDGILAVLLAEPQVAEEPVCWAAAMFPEMAKSSHHLAETAVRALKRTNSAARLVWAPSITGRQARRRPGETTAQQAIVASAVMRKLHRTATKVASSNAPILLLGETGVGKEILAQRIHEQSHRSAGPLVTINCGAITPSLMQSRLFGHEKGAFTGANKKQAGLFETANKGTLLLDEIGELSAETQVALLRVLESKTIMRVGGSKSMPVDVRLLAATHRDLEKMCQGGEFRTDLLFRINTIVLEIPALRDRAEEIQPLAQYFVGRANHDNSCDVSGCSDEVVLLLERYPWPGNIRELRNVLERAVILASSGLINVEHLPSRVIDGSPALPSVEQLGSPDAPADCSDPEDTLDPFSDEPNNFLHLPHHTVSMTMPTFKERIDALEISLIGLMLTRCDWNKAQTARELKIPRRTLMDKLSARPIEQQDFDATEANKFLSGLASICGAVDEGLTFREQIAHYEHGLIADALRTSDGNKTRAARLLQMSVDALKYKLRKMND